nr:MAG TPA: hypothetical protein [Caudoviricetes sp.]
MQRFRLFIMIIGLLHCEVQEPFSIYFWIFLIISYIR